MAQQSNNADARRLFNSAAEVSVPSERRRRRARERRRCEDDGEGRGHEPPSSCRDRNVQRKYSGDKCETETGVRRTDVRVARAAKNIAAIVRANVQGRDEGQVGENSPTHPRCGIDHWWRASEYLQNRSRRTAGLIRRALELIPTTPILKRTSVDATNEQRLREYLVANIELGFENLPAKEENFHDRVIKSFDTERT